MYCNNCGKEGHLYYQCKNPIISCGIILFRKNNGQTEYLMNRRKNSYGYIDMIRGKYNIGDPKQIASLISQMSSAEKNNIKTQTFNKLWTNMWGVDDKYPVQIENTSSSKKFMQLQNVGVIYETKCISLSDLIDDCDTMWSEPEWEFPKGRRNNIKEKDIDCALREFEEETGIETNQISVIQNLITLEETFVGTNGKSYKNKYFLAGLLNNQVSLDCFQTSEVSKLEWKSFDQCLVSIRCDNVEKKDLIASVNIVLDEYRLYS